MVPVFTSQITDFWTWRIGGYHLIVSVTKTTFLMWSCAINGNNHVLAVLDGALVSRNEASVSDPKTKV
jgi:hypothetical protein